MTTTKRPPAGGLSVVRRNRDVSVLRNHRATPAIVDTDLCGVDAWVGTVGAEHNARGGRHRSSGGGIALLGAKVEIFTLDAPVVVERVLDAGTDRVGDLRIVAAVDDQEPGAAAGCTSTNAVVREARGVIDKGRTTFDVEQRAI